MRRMPFLRRCVIALLLSGSALPALAQALDVRLWPLPAPQAPAGQPDLVADGSGGLLLSWIDKGADHTHALRYSRFDPNHDASEAASASGWQPMRTIASGPDWFVNWADTPHLIALPNGTLWAHWLRRNGDGAYNYGIALTRSGDGGATWSAPLRVEPEGASNDYGFVSLWPHGRDRLGIAWLDSRQKPAAGADDHHHDRHGGAAMMLRSALFDERGRRTAEWPLDVSTCDCCPTSVAMSARGPVVVYRGRSEDEVRDTRLVRFDGKAWSKPATVHADGWTFAGCPVNGPAVVADDTSVWVAWYTEADGQPSLRLARSANAGDRFEAPITVAEGRDVLGRAALALDGKDLWVAWLAESGGRQAVWLGRHDGRTGKRIAHQRVADVTARGRASGLPKLQAIGGAAWLVWTDSVDGQPMLRGISAR